MSVLLPSVDNLSACRDRILDGHLIGLPTETVYGLAADATNGRAIAAIFATKSRPDFNPLISHAVDLPMARQLGQFNDMAEKLAAAFWPGPLTLVVPRTAACPVDRLACAGLDTIALRCPAHPVAQQLLQLVGRPLAAPSANPSGRLSPSTAAHVADMLPDIDVLDGGAAQIGLESTIIGCFDAEPVLLRSGGIARADIEARLGFALVDVPEGDDNEAKLAPGRLARHYAPKSGLLINVTEPQDECLLLGFGPDAPPSVVANLSPSGDLVEAASQLFVQLHKYDAIALAENKRLAIMPIPRVGLGEAINDRLSRAAA